MAEKSSSAATAPQSSEKRSIFGILKDTFKEWQADNAPDMAAAVAYWAFLSLAPLLVIVLAIISAVYGEKAAEGQLAGQLQQFMGPQVAEALQGMLKTAYQSKGGTLATVVSVGLLLFSATSLVDHLKRSLNVMWNVEKRPGLGFVRGFLRDRAMGLVLILFVGVLLLASMVVSAVMTAMADQIQRYVGLPPFALLLIEIGLSLGIITVLFAMVYKFLPDVHISWKNVWVGAAVTALLFVIGKYALGIYLARSSVASGYGAAGSLALLLVWVYYSALIVFMGAEFTQVYSRYRGEPVKPSPDAIPSDSPEALAAHPQTKKTINLESCPPEGTEAGKGDKEKPRVRTSDALAVPLPPQKAGGSVVGGILTYFLVRGAGKLAKPKK